MRSKKKNNVGILRLLLFVYRKYYVETRHRWQIWTLFILTFLKSTFPLIYSYILGVIIDNITKSYSAGLDFQTIIPTIIAGALLTFVWMITNNLFEYIETIIFLWVPYLDDEVYLKKYIEIEPRAYEDHKFINKKGILAWNTWSITRSLFQFVEILASIPTIIISFWSIFSLVNIFPLLGTISIIPSSLVIMNFGKKVWNIWGDKGEERVKYSTYRSALWETDFESLQEIFVFKYGKYLQDKARIINTAFTRTLQKSHRKRYFLKALTDILSWMTNVFVLLYSIKLVFSGEISIGMLTFVLTAYQKFQGDIEQILYNFSSLMGNKKVLYTFYTVINWKNRIVNGVRDLNENPNGLSIEFKNVWFKYEHTKSWVLRDINFKIEADEDIAIIGKNGAGKTTLIKLLLRIYEPQRGEILINGINIKELDFNNYYKKVGILSQSFNKLGITASDNILIGDIENSSKRDMVLSAKKADIDEYISQLPLGYDTFITRDLKDGVQFSGGQWQKLAIARAFFRNAKLLILDEPTSSVDSISEERIFENLRKNSKNKTSFIISHRFATVKKADRISVVDKGRVVESGTHLQLLRKNGLYRRMYMKQAG